MNLGTGSWKLEAKKKAELQKMWYDLKRSGNIAE